MHNNLVISNCPCCGSEADLHNYGGGDFRDYEGKKYFIKCEKCGLTTKHSSSLDEVLNNWECRKFINKYHTHHFCCGFALGVLIVTTALLIFNYIL